MDRRDWFRTEIQHAASANDNVPAGPTVVFNAPVTITFNASPASPPSNKKNEPLWQHGGNRGGPMTVLRCPASFPATSSSPFNG